MIWHIFKKDLRLTWKIALVSALLQWMDAALVAAMGTFPDYTLAESPAVVMQPIRQIIHVMAFVAVGLTAISVVQNDRLATPEDDWLVRPIRRLDAMLAKLLFFVVAIMGPIFIGNVVAGIAMGLGANDSIHGAALHVLATALWFGPFCLAIGALASGMQEAMLGAFGCVVLFAITFSAGNAMQSAAYYGNSSADVIGGLTAGIALSGLLGFAMQFYRRRTRHSRVISLAVFAAGAGIALWPPAAAAELSRSVSRLSPASWHLTLKLDPLAGSQRTAGKPASLPTGINGDRDLTWLALRIDGLASNEWIAEDPKGRNEAIVTDAEGELRLKHPFEVDKLGYVWLGVHGNGKRNLQHAVRVAGDYSFYVLRTTGTYVFPTPENDARIPGLGRCGVRDRAARWGVARDFVCTSVLPTPACYDFRIGDERDQRLRPFCGTASNFLSWLWDWNGTEQTSVLIGGTRWQSLVLQDRVGYLAGHLDLDSVQPGDWWAPPPAQ